MGEFFCWLMVCDWSVRDLSGRTRSTTRKKKKRKKILPRACLQCANCVPKSGWLVHSTLSLCAASTKSSFPPFLFGTFIVLLLVFPHYFFPAENSETGLMLCGGFG